jgi:site-specific recombinase XerD
VYGNSREEVEAKLESAGRLYRFSKRETVEQVFVDAPPAVTLDEALEILEMEFDLRGFAASSKQKYFSAVRKFVAAIHKEDNVQSITLRDAKNFILNQRNKCGMAAATCNGYSEGIQYLFVFALGRPADSRLPRFRKKRRLPEVLSKTDVKKLLAAIENLEYRMVATLIYSAGLRVSEAVRLRLSDIRRDKMLIFINQGKGGKDRFAVLSKQCLKELEDYWRIYRPKDYFFQSPISGKKHITTRTIGNAVKVAAKKIGLAQHVTPHTLRRCFATHLIEANTDIFRTMEALGHSSLKSTQIYVHLAGLPGVVSPYDQ